MTSHGAGRLEGRGILITGASRGIGAAAARAAVVAGARVALLARDASAIATLAREIGAGRADSAIAIPCDVRDPEAVDRAIEHAASVLGGIDSAVLSHGVNRLGPIASLSDADWNEVIATNLTGSFHVARALSPRLTNGIVFVASVSALDAFEKFPGFAAYCASKRGLLGLAEVMAVELEPRGVRVHSVCPRGVDTGMFRSTFPGAAADHTPGDVARRILDHLDSATAPPSGSVTQL